MTVDLSKKTIKELIDQIGGMIRGSSATIKAQHIQAEIIRRLIESVDRLNKSTTRLSWIIIVMTFVMLIISVIAFYFQWF